MVQTSMHTLWKPHPGATPCSKVQFSQQSRPQTTFFLCSEVSPFPLKPPRSQSVSYLLPPLLGQYEIIQGFLCHAPPSEEVTASECGTVRYTRSLQPPPESAGLSGDKAALFFPTSLFWLLQNHRRLLCLQPRKPASCTWALTKCFSSPLPV